LSNGIWLNQHFYLLTQHIEQNHTGVDVLGSDGLLAMKSIVVYDRVRSRDIFDLMILTRDHGYTLKEIFAAIDAHQPISPSGTRILSNSKVLSPG
jgi:hypothetical protein